MTWSCLIVIACSFVGTVSLAVSINPSISDPHPVVKRGLQHLSSQKGVHRQPYISWAQWQLEQGSPINPSVSVPRPVVIRDYSSKHKGVYRQPYISWAQWQLEQKSPRRIGIANGKQLKPIMLKYPVTNSLPATLSRHRISGDIPNLLITSFSRLHGADKSNRVKASPLNVYKHVNKRSILKNSYSQLVSSNMYQTDLNKYHHLQTPRNGLYAQTTPYDTRRQQKLRQILYFILDPFGRNRIRNYRGNYQQSVPNTRQQRTYALLQKQNPVVEREPQGGVYSNNVNLNRIPNKHGLNGVSAPVETGLRLAMPTQRNVNNKEMPDGDSIHTTSIASTFQMPLDKENAVVTPTTTHHTSPETPAGNRITSPRLRKYQSSTASEHLTERTLPSLTVDRAPEAPRENKYYLFNQKMTDSQRQQLRRELLKLKYRQQRKMLKQLKRQNLNQSSPIENVTPIA